MATLNRPSTSLKRGVPRIAVPARVRRSPKVVTAPAAVPRKVTSNVAFLAALPKVAKGLYRPSVTLGADPELFIADASGRIVGSEKFLPDGKTQLCARDGIQVEFHPGAGTCRQGLAGQIASAFGVLKTNLDTYNRQHKGEELKPIFKQLVSVRKLDLMALSESSRALGCLPSLNVYGRTSADIDGLTYLKRSAAGHIHLGTSSLVPARAGTQVNIPDFVKLLDIVVANTLVLVDRDEGNAERRKHYGRAGEYRTKPYGIEYRTLSNFWLRSYPLMSLTFGLARQAFGIAYSDQGTSSWGSEYHRGLGKLLLEHVDMERVQRAINTNDYDLALETYQQFVRPIFNILNTYDGVDKQTLQGFDHFITKSAEEWFPGDPTVYWLNVTNSGLGNGWESYASTTLKDLAMAASK